MKKLSGKIKLKKKQEKKQNRKMQIDNHGVLQMVKMKYQPIRPKAKNRIKIQDVTFRDGHQSIFATRGRTECMLTVAKEMDKIGFYSMEMWGGATFDAMHRFLGEDPWERIRTLKKHIKRTPFSMLLRGQNVVGYRHYSDDVVEAFVKRACKNGIDIFRVFDALNDFRNFETVVKVIKKKRKHFQGTICYSLTEMRMGGKIYNIDYYLDKAKELEKMGADSICIKDMAGLIAPYDAYNLIKALKDTIKKPIHLHTHFTSGMGDLSLLKAIEAGVDIIDTCMAPYAYRTSHPAIEPLTVSLLGTNRDTGFDIKKLNAINEKLEKVIPKYQHLNDNTKFSIIDPNVIIHQTPGGMLSNLVNQLKSMGELDKLGKVFKMLPKVRKDLGSVPLVTPTSQIVGIQTVNNVLFDDRPGQYSNITEQVKDLCYGLYGRTPRLINKRVSLKALKDHPRGSKPIKNRPADILEPELPKTKEKVKGLARSLEDVLIAALYPVTGPRFLKWKYGKEKIPDEVKPITFKQIKKEKELVDKALKGELMEKPKKDMPEKPANLRAFNVFVDGEYFQVEVDEEGTPTIANNPGTAPVPKPVSSTPKAEKPLPPAPLKETKSKTPSKPAVSVAKGDMVIKAPMPGMVVSYDVAVGDKVKEGDLLCVLEAMKMNNNITCPQDSIVKSVPLKPGDSVSKGDILIVMDVK